LFIIQKQVERASSLIRQILDFSRRSVIEQSALSLLPFIKEMRRLLKRTLPETIRLELQYEDGDYTVMADPTRLQQVFMNLAVNARDAMLDGGNLSFQLHHVNITDTPPVVDMGAGDWIRISVVDTGVGIHPENLSRIFEPFFTTKPVGQGTGLGLAQVYGIVRQHEGYIDVKSQVGEGTRFEIYLPALIMPPDDQDLKEDRGVIDGTGRTVLLVEDDPTTRAALQALLGAHKFDVLLASNGTEALKILNQKNEIVSLVVSDIVMPEMGGIDLYTIMQIRWPEIEILFITGHPLESQDKGFLERGNVGWLQKPFSITEFNQAVQNLLERMG
jgi:CheY-like chemotaxis protein